MGGTPAPRPFQLDAHQWQVKYLRTLLGLPPGTGKTLILLLTLKEIADQYEEGTVKILCLGSKNSLRVRQDEWIKWGLKGHIRMPHVLTGVQPVKRALRWQNEQVIGSTYNMLAQDGVNPRAPNTTRGSAVRTYDIVLADEVHRAANRRKSFNKALKMACKKAHLAMLATGTAGRRGAHDLWGLFNALDPKRFSSYWRFVYTHCYVNDTPFGKEILGTKSPAKCVRDHEDIFYYRSKKSLLPDLPDKQRQRMTVVLPPKLRKIYNEIANDLLTVLPSGILLVQNTLTAAIKLRQLLSCPAILDESLGVGPALEGVVEYMKDNEEHAVIFTPFKVGIHYMKAYLEKHFDHVFVLRGGMTLDEIRQVEKQFKETKGVLINTIAVAESYSLETCNTAHFVGFDWSPDMNIQAEDRIHRMTSDHEFIHCLYWVHEDSIDDRILDVNDEKALGMGPVLRHADSLRAELQKTL